VIAVRMRDHGAIDRLPRIYMEIAGGTVQAAGIEAQQHAKASI
jgi:hypothetical protein